MKKKMDEQDVERMVAPEVTTQEYLEDLDSRLIKVEAQSEVAHRETWHGKDQIDSLLKRVAALEKRDVGVAMGPAKPFFPDLTEMNRRPSKHLRGLLRQVQKFIPPWDKYDRLADEIRAALEVDDG